MTCRLKKLFIVFLFSVFTVQGYSQIVNHQFKNAVLDDYEQVIRKQTGYYFFYKESTIDKTIKSTLDVNNWPLNKLMDTLKIIYRFHYKIYETTITLSAIDTGQTKTAHKEHDIKGWVTDNKGTPLSCVTITLKDKLGGTVTNKDGYFEVPGVDENAVLVVSHISYETQSFPVGNQNILAIKLKGIIDELGEAGVTINTGYQKIPKERATGSFGYISNSLFNRSVSGNFVDRLQGITGALRFQPGAPDQFGKPDMTIRGESSIFSNKQILFVVDNFPYDGDPNNINPNDIEKIDILKDAAAASIWGAYSGNGVVVITTKKGHINQPLKVELNTNITVGLKPDLYYSPYYINSNDFINNEIYLFGQKFYDAFLNNSAWPAVTPVVEILAKRRAGSISADDSAKQIDALRSYDFRKDFQKYVYRNSFIQQYAANVTGGGNKIAYRFSAGYDQNKTDLLRNDYSRFTFSNYNTFYLLPKLQINAGIMYTDSKQSNNNGGMFSFSMGNRYLYPYALLADDNGNPQIIPYEIRQALKDTTASLYNWNNIPLNEIAASSNITKLNDVRIEAGLRYQVINGLRVEGNLQFEKQTGNISNYKSENSYYVRDLRNRFYDPSSTFDPIPQGGIFDETNALLKSLRLRGQLTYDSVFHKKHAVAAIAGIETGEVIAGTSTHRLYGYSQQLGTGTSAVNYADPFPIYMNLAPASFIPNVDTTRGTTNETVSYFSNASYTYNGKYIVSASARLDQANIFGVNINHKGVPLWSAGIAWLISNEHFYKPSWLPYLKFRGTYGLNGNVNTNVPGLLTLKNATAANNLGLYPAAINNPPNADLGWEKSATINLALEFAIINNILKGCIEYYSKKEDNLIGYLPVAPSTGLVAQNISGYMANAAAMKSHGIDIDLISTNLSIKNKFRWTTRLLFSYNKDKVVNYQGKFSGLSVAQAAGGLPGLITPIVNYPLHSLFSFHWAGLDNSGNPQGMINNQLSTDYSALTRVNTDSMVYSGPARPTFWGTVNNTFYIHRFSFSVNILYELGYYFRAPALSYSALLYSGQMMADFSKRWQKQGDENTTIVPSMIYPNNSARDDFYTNSEVTIQNAGNIRLKDIYGSYNFKNFHWGQLHFTNVELYAHINNIGLIWKANHKGIDPDFITTLPVPRSFAAGFRANF